MNNERQRPGSAVVRRQFSLQLGIGKRHSEVKVDRVKGRRNVRYLWWQIDRLTLGFAKASDSPLNRRLGFAIHIDLFFSSARLGGMGNEPFFCACRLCITHRPAIEERLFHLSRGFPHFCGTRPHIGSTWAAGTGLNQLIQ